MAENGQGNGFMGDAPWWAKAIVQVGIPSAGAIYLVYQLATSFSTDLKSVRENFILHHENSVKLNMQIEYYMRVQNALTRTMCVNAAQSNDARAACFKEP